MSKLILNNEDLLEMLDELMRDPVEFWNDFYDEREKEIPFFKNKPDENLVGYFKNAVMKPGHVLELGSGPGRNAIYFAQQDCEVDAVDLSSKSLEWAKERASAQGLDINFIRGNVFELDIEEGFYDIVYDSGCFHHIAPHRRMSYLNLLQKALKPNGYFALTCFVEGGELGGSELSDLDVYKQRNLNGGLGFTEEKLKAIFAGFEVIEIRPMKEKDEDDQEFGLRGLWTALFRKKAE
ncbi:class I SAM-dependent methyltransferase [Jeotgalibacillus salarius]|uniref:Class I SAM-dependent methyltransferase n=1 Tax=Jeotgalibacillus salarius TaxID=546023 RepID=A0A4Y8LHV6_9BACL|nr:class I SAM-dependent methyltransferase [Jeotgalibacillus salarius]TFE02392.1 class I SAM-dependent methyltransferase [Jeotgalibacillus salarius]